MRVHVTDRPYILTFRSSGQRYPLTSEEAQRLIDEYPVLVATRNRVTLVGHNSSHPADRTTLTPATLGGGPAFVVERS